MYTKNGSNLDFIARIRLPFKVRKKTEVDLNTLPDNSGVIYVSYLAMRVPYSVLMQVNA